MADLCSTSSGLGWKYLRSGSDVPAGDWGHHLEACSVTCVAWARGLKGWDCGLKCLTSHVICAFSQHGGLRAIKFTWWLHCNCANKQGGKSIAFYDLTLEITWQHFCASEVATLCLHSRGRSPDLPLYRKRVKNIMAVCLFVCLCCLFLTLHPYKYKHLYGACRTDSLLQTFSTGVRLS